MRPVFEYTNYREFLRDFYQTKKREMPAYSFRLFSEKAGFKAPNLLKLVMEGKRNLTKESVYKFAKALRLNRRETEYFENLVFFNQSDTLDEKNAYLKQVMRLRGKGDPRRIEQSEYAYYSDWWHPVIRELVTAVDFGGDFRRLGAMVVPPVSAAEAQKSVELLLKLGFVRRGDDGRYAAADVNLTTGPRVRSVAVANYHREMMRLASESIERFGADERDITSLTLAVSEQTRQAIVERLAEMRRELLDMAAGDTNGSRVVQLNLQLFPLSERYGRREVQG